MSNEIIDIRYVKRGKKKVLQVELNGHWKSNGEWAKGKWQDVKVVNKKKGK